MASPHPDNRDKLWLLVFGPSTGLELSEASFLGGILSFNMSRSERSKLYKQSSRRARALPLASSKEVILWLGENPWRAPISEAFPPERAPSGKAPVGVRPFSWRTCSDSSLTRRDYIRSDNHYYYSHLSTENTLAIFPMALILFLITSFLTWAWPKMNIMIRQGIFRSVIKLKTLQQK